MNRPMKVEELTDEMLIATGLWFGEPTTDLSPRDGSELCACELAKRLQAKNAALGELQRALSEALNSGDGSYKP